MIFRVKNWLLREDKEGVSNLEVILLFLIFTLVELVLIGAAFWVLNPEHR